MNKIILVVLVIGCVAALVASTPAKIRDTENISVSLESKEKDETSLEGRIKALKEKIEKLKEDGKKNEKAFQNMEVQVQEMKTKVNIMKEKLKKLNKVDYLNSGVEEIQNL